MELLTIYGSLSGYINIDVKCTKKDKCENKEWEIHSQIDIDASGSVDAGPNLFAFGAGLLNPYLGWSIQSGILGSKALELEYKLLSQNKSKIEMVYKLGPTAICMGASLTN